MVGGQAGGNGPSVQGLVVEGSRLGRENATIQGKEIRFICSFKPLNIKFTSYLTIIISSEAMI